LFNARAFIDASSEAGSGGKNGLMRRNCWWIERQKKTSTLFVRGALQGGESVYQNSLSLGQCSRQRRMPRVRVRLLKHDSSINQLLRTNSPACDQRVQNYHLSIITS